MRLAWIDVPFTSSRLRDMSPDTAIEVRKLGIRITGCPNELDASDSDIEWAKRFLDDHGILPGPPGAGVSPVRPDPGDEANQLKTIIQGVTYSGKLGAPSFRYASGSLNPNSPWAAHPDNVTQEAMDRVVENTKQLVPYAEAANCLLIPETTQWGVINSIERMQEFVERVDSPFVRISFDPVNHMTSQRVYDSGRFVRCAIATLGDAIGTIHCKDVMVDPQKLLVSHIDEAPIGTGLFDHAALMEASRQLEPWKLFSIEHLPGGAERMPRIRSAMAHLNAVAEKIGHTWDDPKLTRARSLSLRDIRPPAGP